MRSTTAKRTTGVGRSYGQVSKMSTRAGVARPDHCPQVARGVGRVRDQAHVTESGDRLGEVGQIQPPALIVAAGAAVEVDRRAVGFIIAWASHGSSGSRRAAGVNCSPKSVDCELALIDGGYQTTLRFLVVQDALIGKRRHPTAGVGAIIMKP